MSINCFVDVVTKHIFLTTRIFFLQYFFSYCEKKILGQEKRFLPEEENCIVNISRKHLASESNSVSEDPSKVFFIL